MNWHMLLVFWACCLGAMDFVLLVLGTLLAYSGGDTKDVRALFRIITAAFLLCGSIAAGMS